MKLEVWKRYYGIEYAYFNFLITQVLKAALFIVLNPMGCK